MSEDRNPFLPKKREKPSNLIDSQSGLPNHFPGSVASQVVGNFDIEVLVRSILNQPHEIPQSNNPLAAALHSLVEGIRLRGQVKLATKWAEKLGALSQVVQNATALERARSDLLRELYLSKMLPQSVTLEYEYWLKRQQNMLRGEQLSGELREETHMTAMQREQLQRDLDKADFEERISEAKKKKSINEDL
jgi:hypothetical protein